MLAKRRNRVKRTNQHDRAIRPDPAGLPGPSGKPVVWPSSAVDAQSAGRGIGTRGHDEMPAGRIADGRQQDDERHARRNQGMEFFLGTMADFGGQSLSAGALGQERGDAAGKRRHENISVQRIPIGLHAIETRDHGDGGGAAMIGRLLYEWNVEQMRSLLRRNASGQQDAEPTRRRYPAPREKLHRAAVSALRATRKPTRGAPMRSMPCPRAAQRSKSSELL